MAERTIVVCDVCGKPATETVTIKVARGNFAKDLCATHVTELIAGARRPRPGRPRKMAGAGQAAEAPKRRGRPRKTVGSSSEGDDGPEDDTRPEEGSVVSLVHARSQEVDALRLLLDQPFARQRSERRLHLPSRTSGCSKGSR